MYFSDTGQFCDKATTTYPHMDSSSQERFRPLVLSRLAEIEEELRSAEDSTKAIAPDVSIGRLSRLDSMQMQQMALAGKRRLEEQRTRLKQALRRIEDGDYGRCGLCGQSIAPERLEHQPDATVCVPCLNKRK
jgi:DnaK suppressor protein